MTASDPDLPPTEAPSPAPDPTPGPPADVSAALGTGELPDRYRLEGVLARGGMGEVWRVFDRELGRTLAMKVASAGVSDLARRRFDREVRIGARLQHPNIVPLFDSGTLPDGRPWLTMPEVGGRTLARVIREVHAAPSGRTDDGWDVRRLVQAVATVCDAVAYAHSLGIVHRDLKPANVLVGPFSEVLIVDWGLAIDRDAEEPASDAVGPPDRDQDPARTMDGRAVGTPAYMAPEQARGDRAAIGPASDVHALGATLFEALAGHPRPVGGSDEGPPVPPGAPPELAETCARALAPEPSERFDTAQDLSQALQAWLTGAARRDRALAQLELALAQRPEIEEARARARHLRSQARDAADGVLPHHPVSAKRRQWRLEDEAEAAERQASVAEMAYTQALLAALREEPDLPDARRLLADHFRRRLDEAEAAGDTESAARFEALLRAYDDGAHARYLTGEGTLSIRTDPPGATVAVARWREEDRRLVARPWIDDAGTTPLDLPLARGSYLVTLTHAGRPTASFPIAMTRAAARDVLVPLPEVGTLGDGDCYVPAGWFRYGADPNAPEGLPGGRVWIDGFVIRRHPVTVAEYLEFLADLDRVDAERHAPRPRMGASGIEGPALVERRADGTLALAGGDDSEAAGWASDWPVVQITWHDAVAYARWFAERTGRPWRLPSELEWEKAARGDDGRAYPWGDFFEPTRACVLAGHTGRPEQTSVHAFEADVSPYGVCGMGGNVRDWCLDAYRRGGPRLAGDRATLDDPSEPADYRIVKGGSWGSVAAWCRSAARFADRPDHRFAQIGFRLARSA